MYKVSTLGHWTMDNWTKLHGHWTYSTFAYFLPIFVRRRRRRDARLRAPAPELIDPASRSSVGREPPQPISGPPTEPRTNQGPRRYSICRRHTYTRERENLARAADTCKQDCGGKAANFRHFTFKISIDINIKLSYITSKTKKEHVQAAVPYLNYLKNVDM